MVFISRANVLLGGGGTPLASGVGRERCAGDKVYGRNLVMRHETASRDAVAICLMYIINVVKSDKR